MYILRRLHNSITTFCIQSTTHKMKSENIFSLDDTSIEKVAGSKK